MPSRLSNRTLTLDEPLHDYLLTYGVRESPAQQALREMTRTHEWAVMQICPEQGAFMQMFVRILGARRAIEVGVFTGYSTLCVAQALPGDGYLLACDISDEYTRLGRPHWQQAGVAHKIDLRLAPAIETLDASLAAGQAEQFDFAFIDADKVNYDAYYERCLALLRVGGVIAVDNVLWNGAVTRPAETESTAALQALNRKLHADSRIDLSMLPIGDGLTLARKR